MGYPSKGAYYWDKNSCGACHSDPADRKTVYSSLPSFIASSMPIGAGKSPADCVDECATEIAGFIEKARNPSFTYPFVSNTMDADIAFDDFEDGKVGTSPAGFGVLVEYNAVNPVGDSYAFVDNKQAHSGSKSVRFKSIQGAQITVPLGGSLKEVYARAWVYTDRQFGGNSSDKSNHETLIALRGSVGSVNEEIRFGEAKGVLGTNRMPGDALAPNVFNSSINIDRNSIISANKWHCVEVQFNAKGSDHLLVAWVNGKEVHRISKASDWHNPTPSNWADGMFKQVVFGYQSWSFGMAAANVWMDDIAVSTRPIGCN